MTTYYVGPGGNNANNGQSWANRKLTLNGAEDIPVAVGDIVYVAPGTYRELLTIDVSGGSSYSTGTVSVTNGSATVTGSGTTFTGNAFANGVFQIKTIAGGTDGVTNGTASFTSAAGNFQSSMIGMTIRINTKNAYIISAVASATSITLKNPDGSAPSPSSASGLTYSVGPEAPYDILSVDSNTQITLKASWNGPSLTGMAYETWKDIRYIADVTGVNTDGIGGFVRITGSDNDQTGTRANCVSASNKNYRTFQGFVMDSTTAQTLTCTSGATNWIIQGCIFAHSENNGHVNLGGVTSAITIRRCIFGVCASKIISVNHSSTVDNAAILVENCLATGQAGNTGMEFSRVGGGFVRNCTVYLASSGVRVTTALTVGQAITVNNCIIQSNNTGLQATVTGEIIEDYNCIYHGTTRSNVTAGANSVGYGPTFVPPFMSPGLRYPQQAFGSLSPWSQLGAKAGIFEPAEDLFEIARPTTSSKKSWGAIQYQPVSRSTGTVRTGASSIKLSDAGRYQIFVPITNASTTISVYVRWETDYAGTKPQMVIKQPGQSDTTVTATGSSGSWEQLTTTLTPAATPGFVVVELVSNNTATSGSYATYFDDLTTTGLAAATNFDAAWLTDTLRMGAYMQTPAGSSVVAAGGAFKGPFG